MAIDTRRKRISMLNFHDGTNIKLLPDTIVTAGQDKRQTGLDCYGGLLFDSPAGAATWGPRLGGFRNMRVVR